MLKKRNEQIQILVRATDAAVCVLSFFAAYGIRTLPRFGGPGSIDPIEAVSWILAASLILHFLIYPYFRFYESLRLKTTYQLFVMVLRAAVAEFFVLGTLVFLVQAKTTSRYFFGLFLGINYFLLLAEKLGARAILSTVRRRGFNYRQVLIVGTGKNAARVIESLLKNRHWGYVPVGVLAECENTRLAAAPILNVPILGNVRDFRRLILDRTIDEILFALDSLDTNQIAEQVSMAEQVGIPVRFGLGMFELPLSKVEFSYIDDLPIVTFYTTLRTPMEVFAKRLIDIVISVGGILVIVLLLPWIAWRIKHESPGPIFFKQERVGENGRRFCCYKFRTMHLGAEAQKEQLMALNQIAGPMFKLADDPRVFPFGGFLRRTSLDELPQFVNVIRGDMSVVGTRPPTPEEVSTYETEYRRRLSIKPGVTGLWQVSGRSDITDFREVLALDLQYIDRWSLALDLKIIGKTLWVVLFGRGAY